MENLRNVTSFLHNNSFTKTLSFLFSFVFSPSFPNSFSLFKFFVTLFLDLISFFSFFLSFLPLSSSWTHPPCFVYLNTSFFLRSLFSLFSPSFVSFFLASCHLYSLVAPMRREKWVTWNVTYSFKTSSFYPFFPFLSRPLRLPSNLSRSILLFSSFGLLFLSPVFFYTLLFSFLVFRISSRCFFLWSR